LVYNGGSYELKPAMIDDLVKRGVIGRAEDSAYFELAADHVIDEVEPNAEVLSRMTGSVARGREGPDGRSLAAGLKAPNGFGGRRWRKPSRDVGRRSLEWTATAMPDEGVVREFSALLDSDRWGYPFG
jgi:hypothetical protein